MIKKLLAAVIALLITSTALWAQTGTIVTMKTASTTNIQIAVEYTGTGTIKANGKDLSNGYWTTDIIPNANGSINVVTTGNIVLTVFNVGSRQITELDVSNAIYLTKLYCDNNQLSTLDITTNTALTLLYCDYNKLSSLNLSNKPHLTTLQADNQYIEVAIEAGATTFPNPIYYRNKTAVENVQINGNTYAQGASVPKPTGSTVSFTTVKTITNGYPFGGRITFVAPRIVSMRTNKTANNMISVQYNGTGTIKANSTSLSNGGWTSGITPNTDGSINIVITGNIALTHLNVYDEQLTELNVSQAIHLTWLSCRDNQIRTLDITNNTALAELRCYNNRILSLDLSNKRYLSYLEAQNQAIEVAIEAGATTFPNPIYYRNRTAVENVKINGTAYAQSANVPKPSGNTASFTTNKTITEGEPFGGTITFIAPRTISMKTTKTANSVISVQYNGTGTIKANGTTLSNGGWTSGITPNTDGSINIVPTGSIVVTYLNVYEEQLTELNVSQAKYLTWLSCHNNQIRTLDITNNSALMELRCYSNRISSLDLSNKPNLSYFDAENQAVEIAVELGATTFPNPLYYRNKMAVESVRINGIAYAQGANVPKPAGTTATFNTIKTIANGNAFSGTITFILPRVISMKTTKTTNSIILVQYKGTGTIKANGTTLSNGSWTYGITPNADGGITIIPTGTIVVTHLNVYDEQLTELNVLPAIYLTSLRCHINQISILNVTDNTALTELVCHSNRLSSLNLSNKPNLSILNAENQAIEVAVPIGATTFSNPIYYRNKTAVENVKINGIAYALGANVPMPAGNTATFTTTKTISNGEPFGGTITIVITGTTTIVSMKTTKTANFNVMVNYTGTGTIKANGKDLLNGSWTSGITPNADGSVNIAAESNIVLTHLNVYNECITELDVTKAVHLKELYCDINQLTTLDVSKNNELTTLECQHNQLTVLDLTFDVMALKTLKCYSNKLTELSVGNKFQLTYLDAKDQDVEIAVEFGATTFPNPIDYYALTGHGNVQINGNNYSYGAPVPMPSGNTVNFTTVLPVAGGNPYSGTIKLVTSAQPEAIVSMKTNKTANSYVWAEYTGTGTIKANNTDLYNGGWTGGITPNADRSINIVTTGSIELTLLYVHSEQITDIDVSKAIHLTGLDCGRNLITTLDVSNNTALVSLQCYNNNLSSLDLSNNPNLSYLGAEDQSIEVVVSSGATTFQNPIYYRNKTAVEHVQIDGTPYAQDAIVPIPAGNTASFTTNKTITEGYPFGGTITFIYSTGIDEHSTQALSFYPNPATSSVTLAGITAGDMIVIMDLGGRKVMELRATSTEQSIDISSLRAGVYVISAGNARGKLVVN